VRPASQVEAGDGWPFSESPYVKGNVKPMPAAAE
jgi:hypothetical protein